MPNVANGRAAKVAAKGKARKVAHTTKVAVVKAGSSKGTLTPAQVAAITYKACKGMPVAQLMALRGQLAPQHLAQHFALRRCLRGQGYFISKQ